MGDKAFVTLAGRTLLEWAVAASAGLPARLLVAAPPDRILDARAACPPDALVVEGGDRRSESVRRLLAEATADVVVIHDVAHPLTPPGLLAEVAEAAAVGGAAIAALVPADFVYRATRDQAPQHVEPLPGAWIAQSPKAFRRDVLTRGYAALDAWRAGAGGSVGAIGDPWVGRWADPGTVEIAALIGQGVTTIEGDPRNVKITTPADLALAVALIDGGLASGR